MPPLQKKRSYIEFTPKRAMASFENLVALANYEERLKEARKIVWRDRGELPVEIQDFWESLEHSSRGGTRAAALAFSIRAGINLVLLVARMKSVKKEHRFALIRHAIFGEDCFRFAGMLGSFVFLYKYILNSLPLLLRPKSDELSSPFDSDDEDIELGQANPNRRARLSTTAQAHQIRAKYQTRGWFALVAGAVAGGSAIMFEKRSRRSAIGQQMFVRGLQGSYNALSTKHNFTIPHGDVLLFSLACGQIMYAFLMRPDTLPHSYNVWIGQAAKIPVPVVDMNKSLIRERMFDPSIVNDIFAKAKDMTAANKTELLTRQVLASLPTPDYGNPFAPCAGVHPHIDSCFVVAPDTFWQVFRWMVPVYGALHFIPMLLFKRGILLKAPLKMLLKAAWGTTRSSAFLGVFVMFYKAMFCGKHNLYAWLNPKGIAPRWFMDSLASKGSFWVMGALTGLSLLVEEKKRRAELAMYVLPKALESAWVAGRGKGLVMNTGQSGDAVLAAVGMGMVMRAYQNDPQHLSGLVRRILYQFVGPN